MDGSGVATMDYGCGWDELGSVGFKEIRCTAAELDDIVYVRLADSQALKRS